jgi:hypothetical protein
MRFTNFWRGSRSVAPKTKRRLEPSLLEGGPKMVGAVVDFALTLGIGRATPGIGIKQIRTTPS